VLIPPDPIKVYVKMAIETEHQNLIQSLLKSVRRLAFSILILSFVMQLFLQRDLHVIRMILAIVSAHYRTLLRGKLSLMTSS